MLQEKNRIVQDERAKVKKDMEVERERERCTHAHTHTRTHVASTYIRGEDAIHTRTCTHLERERELVMYDRGKKKVLSTHTQ